MKVWHYIPEANIVAANAFCAGLWSVSSDVFHINATDADGDCVLYDYQMSDSIFALVTAGIAAGANGALPAQLIAFGASKGWGEDQIRAALSGMVLVSHDDVDASGNSRWPTMGHFSTHVGAALMAPPTPDSVPV